MHIYVSIRITMYYMDTLGRLCYNTGDAVVTD